MPEAPRTATASCSTAVLTASSASLTRTLVTAGKAAATSLSSAASRGVSGAPGKASVARCVCGAPANVLGEKTMTKLMPRLRQLILRRLAIRAVSVRPSTLTAISSPMERPSPSATSASTETSGGPA